MDCFISGRYFNYQTNTTIGLIVYSVITSSDSSSISPGAIGKCLYSQPMIKAAEKYPTYYFSFNILVTAVNHHNCNLSVELHAMCHVDFQV